PGSWWASIITGITELSPKMTVLQVTAWLAYLVVVIPSFLRAGRQPQDAPAKPDKPAEPAGSRNEWWERVAGNRPWAVGGVLVGVPILVAGSVVAALPAATASTAAAVTVTTGSCAKEWTSARPGTQTITVDNETNLAGEINLINSSGAVIAEIETIGPAT